MAQKFGGEFSPEGQPDNAGSTLGVNRFRGRKAYNSNIRVKLLFLAPLPLLFSAIGEIRAGDSAGMMAELIALALLLLSPWLLQSGLEAEQAYNERGVARPPMPRKTMALVLTGIGVFVAANFGWGQSFASSIVFGAVASLLHGFSFGLDPMQKKGMEGMSEFDTERVAKAVDKAEKLLGETLSAAKGFGDRKLEARVESLASAARDMFRTVEEDPRDLSSARKFMGVYLKGARDATIKFADVFKRTKDSQARADYEALLTDLETSFSAQRETMLLENRTDLDVEIETLRDRLKQEGLRTRS